MVAATVAKVDVDIGLLAGGVGIELAEVLQGGDLVDSDNGCCAGVEGGAVGIEDKGDIAGGAGFGAEVIVDAVQFLLLSVVVETIVAALVGSHGFGDALAVVAGGPDVVLDGDEGVAQGGDGVGEISGVVAVVVGVAVGGVKD